jgi:5-methylcytosine-specific restriction protein A
VLTVTGKCERHRAQDRRQQDALRGTTVERGYDWQWRKLRAEFLRANPICQCDECRGKRVSIAQVVDHIQPIETHPELRLAWSNLRSMAKQCHDKHTARTRGWGKGA